MPKHQKSKSRTKVKLTYDQISELTGVHRNTIRNWSERGEVDWDSPEDWIEFLYLKIQEKKRKSN